MRFLKENFGESEELNTFVAQIDRRFGDYYVVRLELNDRVSERYFAYQSAAKKYYDDLVKEAQEDISYYYNAQISIIKIEVKREEDELERVLIDDDNI